jgi:hypothetical protein
MFDYRIRVYARGPYAWGECIEAIRARSAEAALEEGLRRARERFAFADSFEAEVLWCAEPGCMDPPHAKSSLCSWHRFREIQRSE